MNLIEFIKHPAYNYYITTLVHDCLLSVLTGRYFNTCYIKECQIKSGYYIPFNTIKLKGVKVEIKEFISIMTIDCENSDLIRLSNLYDID